MTPKPGPEEILAQLYRFEQVHPTWTGDDLGELGCDGVVSWWAVCTAAGLVLVDPLVDDWRDVDDLVKRHGRCAAIVRTCYWHQRSVTEAANRFGTEVWALQPPTPGPPRPFDQAAVSGERMPGGLIPYPVDRYDEIVIWLPAQAALISGDVLLRNRAGELSLCPTSWLAPDDGPKQVRAALGALPDLKMDHVLVSHGPLVLGGGHSELTRVIG